MRSIFVPLCLVFLCFSELVLAAPYPVGVKGKALERKHKVPVKGAALKHIGNPKKKTLANKASKPKTQQIKKGNKGLSCPVKNPIPKPRKVKREDDDDFALTRRTYTDGFIGFHGTHSVNAAKYIADGAKANKRVTTLPRGSYNGNNAELGPGLYVTDDITTAITFANGSANRYNADIKKSLIKKLANFFKRKKVTASVCMVEAISPSIWSTEMNKIWVPHNLVVHNQKAQEELIKCANYNTANTIRLSALDVDNLKDGMPPRSKNQLVIPIAQFDKVYIRTCMDVTGKNEDQVLGFFVGSGWPRDRDYNKIRQDWNIHGEEL